MGSNRVFNNAKWIIACKIVQSLLQLVVGALSARYLGPSNYGLINYASAVVAFAMPIMKLGFDAVLVYELISSPDKEDEVVGTAMVMNVLSSILCILGVSAFVSIANMGQTITIVVCILYGISVFFSALEMIQYWFQYRLLAKYSSLVMLGSYVVVSAYRIFLLVTSKSVYWFALTNSVDYGIIGISLLMIYFRQGGRFRISLQRAKAMLAKSKHYILAAFMLVVVQSTDRVMLTNMVSSAENGFYSAAITSANVVQFVYIAIIDSFRPVILASKRDQTGEFDRNISRLYSIIVFLTVAQSIIFAIFAKLIIIVLYGASYMQSVPVLRILVWYMAFSLIGTVRNVWILAEQKQKYLWIINLSGAIFSVLLNVVMIPLWGACGAAFSSLMTQIFSNFVLGFIIKPIRPNNMLLLRGLAPKFMAEQARSLLNALHRRDE